MFIAIFYSVKTLIFHPPHILLLQFQMIYLLFLLLGCVAFSTYDSLHFRNTYISIFYLSPFIALWIFIVGGQLDVGTDYYSYLKIFTNKDSASFYLERNEYAFFAIISFFQTLGFYGQFYFYLFAAISVLADIQISRKVANSHYALFFFLFMTVSSLFHNQMNTLRQCTAVYFFTLSVIDFLRGKRIWSIILLLVAIGFHISAIGLLPIYLFLKKVSLGPRIAIILILSTSLLSIVSFDNMIVYVANLIPRYAHYANSEYFESGVNIFNKLTKLVYVPIYLLSIYSLRTLKLSKLEFHLFQLGLLACLLRNLSVVSSITNRFGFYFYILSLLPIFYYLREIQQTNKNLFLMISGYILAIYILKVVAFPTGEYAYNSIFITYFGL